MLGTIVNDRQFIELQKSGVIKIHPFDDNLLKTIHYPLYASKFLKYKGRSEEEPKFEMKADFSTGEDKVEFDPGEYLVSVVRQSICIQDDIVGHFVTSSKLIDFGFSLTCGRIEAPYGQNGEEVRFGIKNCVDIKNVIRRRDVIAYVYFMDLRALRNKGHFLSEEEAKLFKRWERRRAYAEDSGVHYVDESDHP
tara:strand:- start:6 stop:587 length:582 start_codon:yes stop_codon:yes gene_type:complete